MHIYVYMLMGGDRGECCGIGWGRLVRDGTGTGMGWFGMWTGMGCFFICYGPHVTSQLVHSPG